MKTESILELEEAAAVMRFQHQKTLEEIAEIDGRSARRERRNIIIGRCLVGIFILTAIAVAALLTLCRPT